MIAKLLTIGLCVFSTLLYAQDSMPVGLEGTFVIPLETNTLVSAQTLQGDTSLWIRFWETQKDSKRQLHVAYTALDSAVHNLEDFIVFEPPLAKPFYLSGIEQLTAEDDGFIVPSATPWQREYRTYWISYTTLLWLLGIFWGISLPALLLYRYMKRPRPILPPPPMPKPSALVALRAILDTLENAPSDALKVKFLMTYLAAFAESRRLPEMRIEWLLDYLKRDCTWGALYVAIEYALFENETAQIPFEKIRELIDDEERLREVSS